MRKIRNSTRLLSLAICLPAIAAATAGYLPFATSISAQSSSHPALIISSPQADTIILGSRVTVDLVVGTIVLTNPDRVTTAKSGQGHLHIWLDQPNAAKDNALEYFRNEPVTFTGVPEGEHTLVVEVVQNDHSSFLPAVAQIVHFKTELPKKALMAPFSSSSPLSPAGQTPYIPQLAIWILIGLILVNGGLLWWLVTRKK